MPGEEQGGAGRGRDVKGREKGGGERDKAGAVGHVSRLKIWTSLGLHFTWLRLSSVSDSFCNYSHRSVSGLGR